VTTITVPSTQDTANRSAAGQLRAVLGRCRSAFITVGIVSAVVNVLYLTGSFYMLEVYDRVVPGRSVPTLIGLSILAGTLFLFRACSTLCAAGSSPASGRSSTRA
jgi:ATP-binding cassette subfamily C protein